MKELELITNAWDQLRKNGHSAVLATVVKTSGSAYRSPGARLLITRSGERYGSISGGCLEDDLIKKAWWLTETGDPVLKRYDTTNDGDVAPVFGLGCNGIVHVLVERLNPCGSAILDLIMQVRQTRRRAVVAHCLSPDAIGQLTMRSLDKNVAGGNGLSSFPELRNAIDSAFVTGKSTLQTLAVGEFFIEVLDPPIRVVIVGAGSDAVPVTELCRHLGWPVTVMDGRPHYARRERFPEANDVVLKTGDSNQLRSQVDDRTAVVLMSHSYSQDGNALRELSGVDLPYLGVLGPRKRTDQLLAEALSPGTTLFANLHSPIGLDIGADAPEQVALALIAEIQGAFNRRGGGSLRDKGGPIHARASGEVESSPTLGYCDLAV